MTTPAQVEFGAGGVKIPDMELNFNAVSVVSSGELLSVTFPKRYIYNLGIPGTVIMLIIIVIVTFLKLFL